MNISCPKCSQSAPGVDNNNLIIGDKQSEVCKAAKAGTFKGWCRVHDTVPVPSEVQKRIAAAAGCEKS